MLQVLPSPDLQFKKVLEAKRRYFWTFAWKAILSPWGVLGRGRGVDFVVGMFSSTQVAGILSALIVLIFIENLGFLLAPLQKVPTLPLWMLALSLETLVPKL